MKTSRSKADFRRDNHIDFVGEEDQLGMTTVSQSNFK